MPSEILARQTTTTWTAGNYIEEDPFDTSGLLDLCTSAHNKGWLLCLEMWMLPEAQVYTSRAVWPFHS